MVLLSLAALSLSAQVVETEPAPAASAEVETAEASPVLKFGYLSYDEVVKMSPGYDEAQQTVASLRDAYERELERSEEVFSKQFSEYVDGQKTFPENILLKRQNELRQTMEQSLQFKREAKALLDEKEKEVMDALYVEVDRAIRTIGLERGYAFVLNTDGHACPFINVDLGEDITGPVLQRLKNKQ